MGGHVPRDGRLRPEVDAPPPRGFDSGGLGSMTFGSGRLALGALARRLAKLRGRSTGELQERIAQRLSAELEHRGLSSMVGEPTDAQLVAALNPMVLANGGGLAETLHRRLTTRA